MANPPFSFCSFYFTPSAPIWQPARKKRKKTVREEDFGGAVSRLPLWGAEGTGAGVNDSPVGCQSRAVTESADETGGFAGSRKAKTDEVLFRADSHFR
ncbi:MAG: hypothetical protein II727_04010 [Oscillospiraceae bacterium]|nr:hypothetical protein [Oscillospiraceae bacterium]